MTRYDVKWNENFETYKEYVENYGIPTKRTEYKGVKLGNWLANQKSKFNRNELEPERLNTLNEFNPFWNGTLEDQIDYHRKVTINSDWKSKVPNGNTAIDLLFEDNDLYICLLNNIYDCETLMNRYNDHDPLIDSLNFRPSACYGCMINVRETYMRLYGAINGGFEREQIQMLKMCGGEALINSALRSAITEREQQILRLRFGLDDNHPRFFSEISNVFGVTIERVRMIEAKALRKLRHEMKNLLKKSVECDNVTVMRKGEEPKTLEDLELSCRAYYTLKRAGFDTVEKLVNTSIEDFMNVRNMGRRSLEELIEKLKEFGYTLKKSQCNN